MHSSSDRTGRAPAFALGAAFVCLLAVHAPLAAQATYGSIVGTVSDVSGAVVPGAAVTLTNVGTSERRTGASDASGNYQFVNLIPGRYRVEAELGGFKRWTRDEIAVEVQAACASTSGWRSARSARSQKS